MSPLPFFLTTSSRFLYTASSVSFLQYVLYFLLFVVPCDHNFILSLTIRLHLFFLQVRTIIVACLLLNLAFLIQSFDFLKCAIFILYFILISLKTISPVLETSRDDDNNNTNKLAILIFRNKIHMKKITIPNYSKDQTSKYHRIYSSVPIACLIPV